MSTSRLIALLFVASPAFANADDTLPPVRYVVNDIKTGAHLPRPILRSPVALNRRYAELAPDDLAIVRGSFPVLAPGDEPPFPSHGLDDIFAPIAQACTQRRAMGMVRAVATVDDKGIAVEVRVDEAPDEVLAEYVREVMLAERYKPALCAGAPCKMEFPLSLRMQRM